MSSYEDSATRDEPSLWDDEAGLADFRHELLRFARLQLRDAAAAEDVVQEALSAAYATRERFAGRARFKTWVFSILRNKIIDSIRAQTRHPTCSLNHGANGDATADDLFDENGYWRREQRPSNWGDPEAAFADDQFWRVFEICLNGMAENLARVFTLREFLGFETAEICRELAITENNCWVILHRARSRLRRCLQDNWTNAE